MQLPKYLRTWFIIHFVADMLFGLPLLFVPECFLSLFGFSLVETLMARLVGAALIGIGGVSLLTHRKGRESYESLLSLKIIWSLSAIVALILGIVNGAPKMTWVILGIFIIFNFVWVRYRTIIKNVK